MKMLDQKGVLSIDFLEPVTTITAQVYCETFSKQCCAIHNRQKGIAAFRYYSHHDNVYHYENTSKIQLEQFLSSLL